MEIARRLRRKAGSDEETWSRLLLLGAIDRCGEDATPGRLAAAEGLRSSNLAKALKAPRARCATTLRALVAAHGDTTAGKIILIIAWFNLLSLFLNGCRVPMETTDKIGAKRSPLE